MTAELFNEDNFIEIHANCKSLFLACQSLALLTSQLISFLKACYAAVLHLVMEMVLCKV